MAMENSPKLLLTKSFDMSAAEIVRARRTCTVPNQLLRSYQLPSLSSAPVVPRRYEETKPVKVQNFTHQRIIDLGDFINRQSKEEADKIRQLAVEKAVADTWEAAHTIKTQAVKEAIEKTVAHHEKQIRRLAKQHDRAIKEEALLVETAMQNKMREALEEQREAADSLLEQTIRDVEEKCAQELKEAVAAARKEEQEEAERIKIKLLEDAARALEATKQKLIKDKEEAVSSLGIKKDSERVVAVKAAHEEEIAIRLKQVAELKELHIIEVAKIEEEIIRIESQISGRDQEIERIQHKRELLFDELVKVQADYQQFVDRHPLFDPGQSGYMVPSWHSNPSVENPYNESPAFPRSKTGMNRPKSNKPTKH